MNAVQIERTKSRPRRMRFAVVAAAMVCVLIGGAFAAGPIVGLASSMNHNQVSTSLDDESKVEKEAGFTVRLPETLNGASFDNMIAQPVDAVDADGNTVYSYQESLRILSRRRDPAVYERDQERKPFVWRYERQDHRGHP